MTEERFSELLPWYVNGTLDDEERGWVDRYLQEHPEASAELAWFESLRSRIKESPAVPATIGLARSMQLIRGDQPTWSERISAFFGGFALRPAFALGVFAVLGLQSAVIYRQMQQVESDEVEIRALRAVVVDDAPLLKVNFAPEASEVNLRLLLVSVQGTLAGGPGQLGDYYIRVPAGQEAQAAETLKANRIVQAVALVPGLPPRD